MIANDKNEREQYMLDALRVFAAYGGGEPATTVLRLYMSEHKIPWNMDEDVKEWMLRIAEDAISFATGQELIEVLAERQKLIEQLPTRRREAAQSRAYP